MLRAIDLFAGIGGIRLGWEGHARTVLASEVDPHAARCYAENFPGTEIVGDVRELDEDECPDFDLCLAGFPCQAFSYAGRKEGFADTRGTLFREVVRLCEAKRPSVIFCENVKGLVGHDKGRTFKTILGEFDRIGYKAFWKVLDSRDFGVPQRRERVYVVAFRNDVAPSDFEWPVGNGKACLRDVLEGDVEEKHYISEKYLAWMKEHRARHEAKGNNFGYVVRDLDDVAGAIVCGGSGHERNLVEDPQTGRIRRMTPREWARLQGFPEDYRFTGSMTRTYRQLANSVTVPVIKAIAEKVVEKLEGRDSS